MAFFVRKKSKKEQMEEARRKRRAEQQAPTMAGTETGAETSRALSIGIFLLLAILVGLICFVGQSAAGPQIMANQVARVRITADFPFDYTSKIQTQRLRDQRREQVAPVYRLDMEPFHSFRRKLQSLDQALNTLNASLQGMSPDDRIVALDKFVREYRAAGLPLNPEDVNVILNKVWPEERTRLFEEGLMMLRERFREGIYNPLQAGVTDHADLPYFLGVQIEGERGDLRIQDEAQALKNLSYNVAALDADPAVSRALFRILKTALKPNIVYDQAKTEQKIKEALDAIPPVRVHVREGDTLVEPGSAVTADQVEMLTAYRQELKKREELGWGLTQSFLQRIVYMLAVLLAAAIHIRVALPDLRRSNRALGLASVALLVNLGLVRLVLQLGDTNLFGGNAALLSLLPYAAPTALAPMIVAITLGAAPAGLVALLMAFLTALMVGSSLDIFTITFVSSLCAIYACREVRQRAKVVRAGATAGMAVALCAAFIGIFNEVPLGLVGQEIIVSLVTGGITGILAIGSLTLIENLFKTTTDITLLELTDFNHPLLRRMQMVAPGSYHHSLMVANLAERAAAEIGANPLACRACALFHDIGKMAKPEYFTENQRDGINPHIEKNPSMSALVIKSHVKEGVEMAKQYRLPRMVIDVIQQHHGTTLIQYFYQKALQRQAQITRPPFKPGNTPSPIPLPPSISEEPVAESIYRYDGPRPRFKESAVIFFADSVEAASRSLKKVTPQSVEELIERIFNDRIEDHQLDECPITVQEVKQIKQSFAFTLLNMLHSRIEYPSKDAKEATPAAQTNAPTPQQPAPPEASSPAASPAGPERITTADDDQQAV